MSDESPFGSASLYANSFSFLGWPLSRDIGAADAVVVGVPYDLATTGRAGARHGPAAIRQASSNLRWERRRWPWPFALGEALRGIDYGDIEFEDGNSADMAAQAGLAASRIAAAGKFLLALGGDHFVTLPLLRAVVAERGPLALVHFDAHTDTYATGGAFDHGTMFHAAIAERLIVPERSVQLAVRTEYERDAHAMTVIDADAVNGTDAASLLERVRTIVSDAPVYITVDIDCLDPAFAPGTGTPVTGGITSNALLQLIRGLAGLDIVAADVMEVAPAYDHADVTALAAATVALELLHARAADQPPIRTPTII